MLTSVHELNCAGQARLAERIARTKNLDNVQNQFSHLGLHDASRYFRAQVWHDASLNGHSCNAQLVEDDLSFDCEIAAKYGSIQSIVLNYIPRFSR